MTHRTLRRARTFTVVLLACLAVSLVAVAYPIYVIRPFRHQGARELAWALAVTRFRPAITVISALTAVLATIGCWRAQPAKVEASVERGRGGAGHRAGVPGARQYL